jgi:hypothetical protein
MMASFALVEAHMIQSHPKLTPPPDDAALWRYMDITKLLAMFEDNALWFTQAKQFQDKYEGVLPKVVVEEIEAVMRDMLVKHDPDRLAKHGPAILKRGHQFRTEMARESLYISCWHKSPHQSEAMWKLYLSAGQGVAVRSSLGKMKAAFANTAEDIEVSEVKYIDYTTEWFDAGNGFIPVIHKQKIYEHEKEVRLIWWALPTNEIKTEVIDGGERIRLHGPPGRYIPVSLPDLIEEIYVAPGAPGWLFDLVGRLVRRYGFGFPVRPSDIEKPPSW